MLQAIIHGKLPSSVWNSEDVVTSSILGGFQYLSNIEYVIQVLCSSVDIHKSYLTFPAKIKDVRYEFWPLLNRGEPDVLLILTDENDDLHLISIEAKYMSPKSSQEDETVLIEDRKSWQRDQLSRELEDLYDVDTLKKFKIDGRNIKSRQLIYLTNHTVIPENDIRVSLNNSQTPINNIYWLSWATFYDVACLDPKTVQDRIITVQDRIILSHLRAVCELKNLTRFRGWGMLYRIAPFSEFYTSQTSFLWPSQQLCIVEWKYN